MKYTILFVLAILSASTQAQNLQLHYDFRRTLDPSRNSMNFPTIYFEYLKAKDTTGSFFIKTEANLNGLNHNIGKFYTQASQSFRFWKPKIYAQIQYSGGMGIAEPGSYAYYITNAFSVGGSYLFQWKKTYINVYVSYNYNAFRRPSHDLLCSLYWWKGLWNYKFELSGDVQLYTLNNNLGDTYTSNLSGKKLAFFGEPQFWFKIHNGFALGSKVNMYYHVLTNDGVLQVYPTVAARFKFN